MLNDCFQIKNSPAATCLHYIPNFITKIEEQQLLQSIYNVPKTKWTQLSKRRLQNWGGTPHPMGMVQEPIPQWLQVYLGKINELNIFNGGEANHVLINEYKPNEGIMPHLDGPLYFPAIATITLGSHTVLDFYDISSREDSRNSSFSLFLEPCSLLVQQGKIYHDYMHGIVERKEDIISEAMLNLSMCEANLLVNQRVQRSVRVSLTIRRVLKTSKLKVKLCR